MVRVEINNAIRAACWALDLNDDDVLDATLGVDSDDVRCAHMLIGGILEGRVNMSKTRLGNIMKQMMRNTPPGYVIDWITRHRRQMKFSADYAIDFANALGAYDALAGAIKEHANE